MITLNKARQIAEKIVKEDDDKFLMLGEKLKDYGENYVFGVYSDFPFPQTTGLPSYCLVNKNTGVAKIDSNFELLNAVGN